MKKLSCIVIVLLLSVCIYAKPNLKQRLIELNVIWSTKSLPIYSGVNIESIDSDVDLIKTHLLLVHHELSLKPTFYLSKSQREKRTQLLEDLKAYAEAGIFPKNLDYSYRIPYFIDAYNTACAVGQLMINSGAEDFAMKIKSESNNLYLREMHYPEIQEWATTNGFTIEELKWIQPSYGPSCPPNSAISANCYNGYGCLNPAWYSSSLDSASLKVDSVQRNSGKGWELDTIFMFNYLYWGAIAPPGDYRFYLSDSLGGNDTLFYTILSPPPILMNYISISQTTSCYNSVQVNASGGVPPYSMALYDSTINQWRQGLNGRFDSLCPGNYQVNLNDANNCFSRLMVQAGNSVSIVEQTSQPFSMFNDFVDNSIGLRGQVNLIKQFAIYNLKGQKLKNSHLTSDYRISLNGLSKGVYILVLYTDTGAFTQKFVAQ